MTPPSQILVSELKDAKNFIHLASVLLDDTTEARVFRMLLDNYTFAPEGVRVSMIEEETALSQSVVSNALKKLRNKGAIGLRQEGQVVYNFLFPETYEAVKSFSGSKLIFGA